MCKGDEEEWHQQCAWHSELVSSLEKIDVCIEQLQQDQERYTIQEVEWTPHHHTLVRFCFIKGTGRYCLLIAWLLKCMDSVSSSSCIISGVLYLPWARLNVKPCLFLMQDKDLRLKELWEQCCSKQAELDAAVNALHVARLLSQLCANTAQVCTKSLFLKTWALRCNDVCVCFKLILTITTDLYCYWNPPFGLVLFHIFISFYEPSLGSAYWELLVQGIWSCPV